MYEVSSIWLHSLYCSAARGACTIFDLPRGQGELPVFPALLGEGVQKQTPKVPDGACAELGRPNRKPKIPLVCGKKLCGT